MNKNIIAAAAGVAAGVAIFFAREKTKALRATDKPEEYTSEPVENTEEPESWHNEEIVIHKPVDDDIDLDKAIADAQDMMDEKNSPRPVKKVNRKVESVTDEPGWTYPDDETYLEYKDLPDMNLFWFINDDMTLDVNDLPITEYVEDLIGDLREVTEQNGGRGLCINHQKGLRFSMEIIEEPIADYMREMHGCLEDDEEYETDDE